MLHDFLFASFSDTRQHQLYEQLRAVLHADALPSTTLLLGNLALEDGQAALDAVIVRPHSITVLILVPRGGELQVPALGYGAWQLEGAPLQGAIAEADNPYEQFRQQKQRLIAWLNSHFGPEQANLQFISGLVVFAAPVTFGPGVEAQLSQQPDSSFQLLGNLNQLPRRLAQLACPEIDLREADLTKWARTLAGWPASDGKSPMPDLLQVEPVTVPTTERSFLRRAWAWLGAEDVPEDVPYGGQPSAQAAASTAEKQRLEQVQRHAQVQMQQQLEAMEVREAEREQRIEELRQQLAQASPITPEAQVLQERLATESREKAALEEAIRTSQAESEIRNRELDAKITQLGHLIEQLNAQAASSAATSSPKQVRSTEASQALPPVRSSQARQQRRRGVRALVVAGVVVVLAGGVWGTSHLGADVPSSTAITSAMSSTAATEQLPPSGEREETSSSAASEAAAPRAVDEYEARYPYADGYARVRKQGAYTFIDHEGQEFPATFSEARDFSEGYAAVRDERGWYYITGPQEEDPSLPPFLFVEAYSFHDGLARVRLKPGYTYITTRNLAGHGPSVFELYEQATDFENGRAHVTLRGRRFSIDTNGQPVE